MNWDWTECSAALFGNEASGLGSEERDLCDTILKIPHSGQRGLAECCQRCLRSPFMKRPVGGALKR